MSANIKEDLEQNPLIYDGVAIKEKESEKYLGDMLNGNGLSASIASTISERHGRIYSSILEIKTILEDYRANTAGGMTAGIMLWEMGILPSLLNNSETWTNLNEECLKKLNDLQNMFLRMLFNTAITAPKVALFWDSGICPIEQQIEQRKLLFLHHLITLPVDSLANQFYREQRENKFPGLVTECRDLIVKYDLPDITMIGPVPSKARWSRTVKSGIREAFEAKSKLEIQKLSKLENIDTNEETFSTKPYLRELSLSQARTKFKLRSRMLEVKNNFQGGRDKTKLLCAACETCVETQDHILFCPSYNNLRVVMNINNDMDLVNYVREVMNRREKNSKKKK